MRGHTSLDRAALARSARAAWQSSFRRLDDWQDPELTTGARVSVHGIGAFNLRAHCDDLYHVLPAREAMVVAAIKARLRPGDIFVDAGANIGFFTVLASRLVGTTGKIIAIEMMPDTATRLRDHIELNKLRNVNVIEHALDETSGRTIIATVPEGQFGQASIVMDDLRKTLRQVSVTTRTLDDILAGSEGPIAILKIDIEGAEIGAIQGARHVLSRTNAVIFEQLGEQWEAGRLLSNAGFILSQLDGNNWLAERTKAIP